MSLLLFYQNVNPPPGTAHAAITIVAAATGSPSGTAHAVVGIVAHVTGAPSAQGGTAAAVVDIEASVSGFPGFPTIIVPAVAAPAFSATTMRLYQQLPDMYRSADVTAGTAPNDYPLLRWLACLVDQGGDLEALVDSFQDPTASALTDPMLADEAWLPWLASATGTKLSPGMSAADQRTAIASSAGGFYAGTKASMIAVARGQLTGGKSVELVDHVDGDMWQMQIITRPSETPQPSKVVSAIVDAGCKPAGVNLIQLYYEASWDTIEAAYPNWNAIEAAASHDPLLLPGTWGVIEETQPRGGTASWDTIETRYLNWTQIETAGSWAAIETP